MRQLNLIITLLAFVAFSSCKKDNISPIDQLPAKTMAGKNTFGCLVNGKVHKPKGVSLSGANLECYYMLVDGIIYFHLSASDKSDRENGIRSVRINAKDFEITKTGTYKLESPESIGSPFGTYAIYKLEGTNEYNTFATLGGELTITRFDLEKRIVSGTFWFDAVNEVGEKVEVREGRFDMQFNR